MLDKKCSIFFYEGYVGIAPTIINLAKVLSQQSARVSIYGSKNQYAEAGELGVGVETIYFTKGTRLFDLLIKKGFKDLVPLLELGLYVLQYFVYKAKHFQPSSQQKINVGVDIYGAIAALINFYIFREKFLFLSLELHDPQKFKGISRVIADWVKIAYRKSAGLIIQDEDRFKTFCQYYNYQHPQCFYLPNSPLGFDESTVSDDFFRDKFKLSPEQFPCIVIQAGMIGDAVYSKDLAFAFNSIDNGSALVFHERQKTTGNRYTEALLKINPKNLFLSLDPLPYDQIDRIYRSATIGLAFYADLGNNFTQISMASGKLSQYLKYGKPVLVNNLPSLAQLINKYKIGIAIENPADPEEIKLAIAEILGDYDTYSQNAKSCFAAEFDFAKKMQPILSLMSVS